MNDPATELKPKSILRFSGFNGESYECVFYHEFQTEEALRMINLENGASLMDPSSVINE